jgi:hypothetical protein
LPDLGSLSPPGGWGWRWGALEAGSARVRDSSDSWVLIGVKQTFKPTRILVEEGGVSCLDCIVGGMSREGLKLHG